MKKLILKKYDNDKIKFYKTFFDEQELKDFAEQLTNEESPLLGPLELKDKILYTVNLKFHTFGQIEY